MLNVCLVYISIHIDLGFLRCFLKPFLACGTCVGPVAASLMFVITSACSQFCTPTHAFVCRLVGSEGFRQQILKRRGKLVLLAPPKAGVGVNEEAEYIEPILTAAAGGSLAAYRR